MVITSFCIKKQMSFDKFRRAPDPPDKNTEGVAATSDPVRESNLPDIYIDMKTMISSKKF